MKTIVAVLEGTRSGGAVYRAFPQIHDFLSSRPSDRRGGEVVPTLENTREKRVVRQSLLSGGQGRRAAASFSSDLVGSHPGGTEQCL